MSDVQWIKITTNMFQDEKIDFIESLPEKDAILIIWVKLLAQAGKNNMGGFIFLTEKIPYTEEMLAHKFRRPLNTVKLALQTLKELEMIEYNNKGFLKITNWEKHQNVAGLDKIREQTRARVAKSRENKRLSACNATCNATVTHGNETEEELEEDIDIDKDTNDIVDSAESTKVEKPNYKSNSEELWQEYPKERRESRNILYKWYSSHKITDKQHQMIMQGLKIYKNKLIAKNGDYKYSKGTSRWLNSREWEDVEQEQQEEKKEAEKFSYFDGESPWIDGKGEVTTGILS